MIAYAVPIAVVIKTQLEVPDNRLCNVVTLCDCDTRMRTSSLPCAGKV
jgi:hypothetical protein